MNDLKMKYFKDDLFLKLIYKCNETSIQSKQYYLENKKTDCEVFMKE